MTISQLRRYRQDVGITQLELARVSQVSRQRLCMSERRHIDLQPGELEALRAALRAIMRSRANHLTAALEREMADARLQ